jgi:hypothetical protein
MSRKAKSREITLSCDALSEDLETLQAEANDYAGRVEAFALNAVDAGVECGRRLQAIRERLPHGQWGKWIGSRWDYDLRTAERYMSLAQYAGAIANQPTITRALEVIANLREDERAAAGKPSRRKAAAEPVAEAPQPQLRPEPEPEPEAEERWETEPEPDSDDWDEPVHPPTIAVPTPRKAEPDEPVRRVHLDELPAGDETAEPFVLQMRGEVWIDGDGRRIPFVAPADRLHWIGYDGVELVQNPLELLDYIAWMVAEAEPEQVQAVVRGCMGLVSYLEGHDNE